MADYPWSDAFRTVSAATHRAKYAENAETVTVGVGSMMELLREHKAYRRRNKFLRYVWRRQKRLIERQGHEIVRLKGLSDPPT